MAPVPRYAYTPFPFALPLPGVAIGNPGRLTRAVYYTLERDA